MAIGLTIDGTNNSESISGFFEDDTINGNGGDDQISGFAGRDGLFGGAGFDSLFGGRGNDRLHGGTQNDNLHGEANNDLLHGDNGRQTEKGSDLSSDNLNGGAGRDVLFAGDGNDALTGGAGADSFFFKWSDPMIGLAAGTGRSFANLTDFSVANDRLLFDVAGVGADSNGANFIGAAGAPSSFFSGATANSNGEAVMVLTDVGFASGADAVTAAQNEALGDFVLYFNTTVNVASLLFVDETDMAHSIARFANVNSLAAFQASNFSADDFLFV